MTVIYLAMIIGGLAAIAGGLPAAHRLRPPRDTAAAFLVLAGVISALAGVLLLVVPGFFTN